MARDLNAGKATITLGIDTTKLKGMLRNATKMLKQFAVGATVAASAAAAFAIKATQSFVKMGDEMHKMSLRTGVAVEQLTALKFAAEQNGTTIGQVEKALKGMSRVMFDAGLGSQTAVDTMDALGLSLKDLQGLNPEQQFKVFIGALSGVEDHTEQAALAMRVFGRAGADLLPMIKGGVDGLNALQQQAHQLGITMTTSQAEAAATINDRWNTLTKMAGQAFVNIGSTFADEIQYMLEVAIKFFGQIDLFIEKMVNHFSRAWAWLENQSTQFVEEMVKVVAQSAVDLGVVSEDVARANIEAAGISQRATAKEYKRTIDQLDKDLLDIERRTRERAQGIEDMLEATDSAGSLGGVGMVMPDFVGMAAATQAASSVVGGSFGAFGGSFQRTMTNKTVEQQLGIQKRQLEVQEDLLMAVKDNRVVMGV